LSGGAFSKQFSGLADRSRSELLQDFFFLNWKLIVEILIGNQFIEG
jgi:hypothetical protein